MRRFIITSTKFTGQVELVYNDEGLICLLDFRNAQCQATQINWLKNTAPLMIADLEEAFKSAATLTVVESDFEITFEMFWLKYRKKINRLRAEANWKRLSKTQQVKAYYGIDAYDKFLDRMEWRKKQDPENYLKNKMWESEYE